MEANAAAVLDLFETKMQIEVPLFQRQYVWEREKHWEPLWEDISRKFTEYLEGRRDAPLHFLGAMVLDQKQTPTTHVPRRQVIDGQQRLTTPADIPRSTPGLLPRTGLRRSRGRMRRLHPQSRHDGEPGGGPLQGAADAG